MKLSEQYANLCNKYIKKLFGEDYESYYSFWIGDESGGVFCYSDQYYSFDDIMFAVNNDVSIEKLDEYNDYTLENYYKHNTFISFKNYLKNAPDTGTEDLKRNWTRNMLIVENIKLKAIKEYKESLK